MGGYDLGFDVMGERTESYRVIAPSRFGYPGSDMPENATVDMQVEAFLEFLDKLGIEKTFITATSAGGTVAERFALMHPEKCKGLVLYCSGYPENAKYWSEQIPGCKSVFFAGGGHLMNGNSEEINRVVDEFVEENK